MPDLACEVRLTEFLRHGKAEHHSCLHLLNSPIGTPVHRQWSLSRGFQNWTCNIMSFCVKLNKDCFSFLILFYTTFSCFFPCTGEPSNKSCFCSCELTVLRGGKSNAVKYRSFVSVLIK